MPARPAAATDQAAARYLDGVIDTSVNLMACRVPELADQPDAHRAAARMMILSAGDADAAVRLAMSRAMEEAGSPLGRHAVLYLQAAIVILADFPHSTHRKG